MNILIKKILLAIPAVVFFLNANAQGDFVITVSGDSILCKITSFSNGKGKYLSDDMIKPEKISVEKIREVYVAKQNIFYRAVYINFDKKPTYLTVLEKGKISLYQKIVTVNINSYNGVNTTATTWYIGKGSDYVYDIKGTDLHPGKSSTDPKADFAKLLIDNKAAYDKFIGDDKFSFAQIRNIVHFYNTGNLLEGK